LKKFFVTVACLHPDLIPNDKVVWAPIPFDARHPQPGFRYMAVIDILEVVVVSPGSPPPRRRQAPTSSSLVGQRRGLVSLRRARVGPRQPPSGSGGASSSSSRPSGGGTPSVSFRDGSTASGAGPWMALAGSAPLFGAQVVPPLPPPRPRSYPEWGLQGIHPSAGVFSSLLGSSSVSVVARAASGGSSVGGGPAQVASSSAAGPPAPHSAGRSASHSEEVEVRSRGREESTPPLCLASGVGPSGSASSPRRSCSPGVDV
jgi:hypothetical protein